MYSGTVPKKNFRNIDHLKSCMLLIYIYICMFENENVNLLWDLFLKEIDWEIMECENCVFLLKCKML